MVSCCFESHHRVPIILNNKNMPNKISIIIIVKNDRGIADTLAHLVTQEKPASTEILVIDASLPDTLKDIRDTYPMIKWFQFHPRILNKSSIPEQRNYGIRQANGDIIVFIDANCVPADDWLTKLTAPIIGGEENITAGPFGSVDVSKRVVSVGETPHEYVTCSGTGNLAFRKSVWEKVGGFDENFLYGSDVDYTWRCVDKGYRIRFVNDAPVTHDWGTFREDIVRYFKYGKARADLLMKHPQRATKQLFGESSLILVYTVWILGLPLMLVFPWYPLILLILIIKNIRNNPIKTVILNLTYTLGFLKRFLTVKLLHVK